MCSNPAFSHQVLTTYQTTFWAMPSAPYLSESGDSSKDFALTQASSSCPFFVNLPASGKEL